MAAAWSHSAGPGGKAGRVPRHAPRAKALGLTPSLLRPMLPDRRRPEGGSGRARRGVAVPIVSAVLETASTNLRGFVVVDSLVDGKAMGGIRMTGTVSPAELTRLAHHMTLKLALAGLPIGGAKAGIVATGATGAERDAQLRSFGRAAAPFLHGGLYLGTDQGMTYRDRAIVFEAAGYCVETSERGRSLPCTWTELWDLCGGITGHGVAEATAVAAREAGLVAANGPRVVIQGFGTVGRGAAARLSELGFTVVGVADHLGTVAAPAGLDVGALLDATDACGTIDRSRLPADVLRSSAPEAWLDVDTDVLILAATGGAVRADNVGRVTARVVVEGANEPCTDDAIDVLAMRDVPVVPGIVANCGGAMVTGLVLTGRAPATTDTRSLAQWFYDRIAGHVRTLLADLFDRARGVRQPLPIIAAHTAAELAAMATGEPVAVDHSPIAPVHLAPVPAIPVTPHS